MKTYNMKETASRIRDLRKIHRYTQEQAAELLGIDRRSLSYIENAARGCSLDLLLRIADIYNVSLDYLVLGEGRDYRAFKASLNAVIGQLIRLRDAVM